MKIISFILSIIFRIIGWWLTMLGGHLNNLSYFFAKKYFRY